MKKISITILIASYNAEERISIIFDDLKHLKIPKSTKVSFVIHVDKGHDNTINVIKNYNWINVKAFSSKKRLGFGGVIQKYIKINNSDFLLILNDDIRITDPNFIYKIYKSIINNKKLGFACVQLKPENGNFIQRANKSSFTAYRKMSLSIKHGNNVFTCDGKVMLLSRSFMKKIEFPRILAKMGNVDCYLYFSAITLGFKYRYIKNAYVSFVFPSTIKDYIKWTTRNNSNEKLLVDKFGYIVIKSYKKPKRLIPIMFVELLKNPLGSLVIYLVGFYIKILSKKYSANFNPKWDTIKSSKQIALN